VSRVFYLLVLTRGRLYRSANVVSADYSNFCLHASHLAPSFGVTPLEFMEKLLRFLKLESSEQPTVKIW